MDVATYAILLAGALAGGFVSGLAGFGTALMALGLWLYILPPAVAVPLVLIHGWAMHGGVLQPLVEALTARCTMYVVDLPGHGYSRDCGLPLEPHACARAIAAATPPAIWLGWSLGGLVACGYVLCGLDRPLPDVLVLSAPALDDNQPGWQRPSGCACAASRCMSMTGMTASAA